MRVVFDQELENDREHSWRWQDWSRALLQEHCLTTLAPDVTLCMNFDLTWSNSENVGQQK